MRIDPRAPGESAWYLRPFFWNQRRKYGAVLESALLWARTPKVFLALALLYGMFDRKSSPVNPVLRSLLTVRVSQINGCAFCVDLNSATLLRRSVAEDKVMALAAWRGSNQFDPAERVALEYAEAVTRSDTEVDEPLMDELKRHFDDDAIVEITGLIAFQNMSSKFNRALAVPAQGFCRIPIGTEVPDWHSSEQRLHATAAVKSSAARKGDP